MITLGIIMLVLGVITLAVTQLLLWKWRRDFLKDEQ